MQNDTNPQAQNDARKEQFLAEAKRAEALAARASSPEVRESWLKIADGYRHLARDQSKT